METLEFFHQALGNTKVGLALALGFVLQYAIITGLLFAGFYRKRPATLIWNVLPFFWLVKLTLAVAQAFYETTILRSKNRYHN
ncbi:hypothetical protein MA9V2_119 [Chryseobacterium phage MA9V-2]|nr:hypothetical protein MA9V2_119 [Chryseobacterium phage MA9V-2]